MSKTLAELKMKDAFYTFENSVITATRLVASCLEANWSGKQ